MNILLTGRFGNVGTSTLGELLKQGHRVRCFDLKTKMSEKAAQRIADRAEVMWGDLRNPSDVAAAVQGQEVVVHLAFIIPKLSATGVESEKRPDWARGDQRRRHTECDRGDEGPAAAAQAGVCLVAARLWLHPGSAATAHCH